MFKKKPIDSFSKKKKKEINSDNTQFSESITYSTMKIIKTKLRNKMEDDF